MMEVIICKEKLTVHISAPSRIFWVIFFFFIISGYLFSQDYEPVICESTLPYKGAPLHDTLYESVWESFSGSIEEKLEKTWQAHFNKVADELLKTTNSPAISAAIGIPGKGHWAISKGLALTDPETPLDTISYFHWASVGKAFTATAAIQMAEENKLKFTDPLAKWIPDFPNANVITVNHLLLHTSGTFSFNHDLPFRNNRGYKPPKELIDIAKEHGNAFCPGEYWAYSNTNYVLLGLILEAIEKKPLHQILTERIIYPLRLNNTKALMPEQHPTGLVKGHTKEGPDEQFNESLPFGAGIIVSSAKDMIIFWHGLLTGKLCKPKSIRDAFSTLFPMFDNGLYYGRGVMLYEIKNDLGERVVWWLGHSGGTQGIKTIIAYDMDSKIYVAVALNNTASAEAAANKLLTEAKRLLIK